MSHGDTFGHAPNHPGALGPRDQGDGCMNQDASYSHHAQARYCWETYTAAKEIGGLFWGK